MFLSSTRTDLIGERTALYWALREAGHEVVWMEDYGSRTITSWQVCAQELVRCDAVVLVLGRRYGTELLDAGMSYTEAEHDLAQQTGIPTLVYVKEGCPDLEDSDNPLRLKEFLELVNDEHQVSRPYFRDPHELALRARDDVNEERLGPRAAPRFHRRRRPIAQPDRYANAAVTRRLLEQHRFVVTIADLAVIDAPAYPEQVRRRVANKVLQLRADLLDAGVNVRLLNEIYAAGPSQDAVLEQRAAVARQSDVIVALVSRASDVDRLKLLRPTRATLIVCYPAWTDEPRLEATELVTRYTSQDLTSCELVAIVSRHLEHLIDDHVIDVAA